MSRSSKLFFAAVPEAAATERFVAALLDYLKKKLPTSTQLSTTIALEHLTAIMADGLLREPRILENADTRFATLWRWHALEETEHKAVAYDVWETAMGRGPRAYAERSFGLVFATGVFLAILVPAYLRVLKREGKLGSLSDWRQFTKNLVTDIPYFPRLVRPWFDYFRPGFRPWDHDNRHFLKDVDTLEPALAAA